MWAEKTNARALELERRGMDREEEGVGEKEESLSPYKGSRDPMPPHLPDKLTYSPSVVLMARLGYPHLY